MTDALSEEVVGMALSHRKASGSWNRTIPLGHTRPAQWQLTEGGISTGLLC
jgi:hypothetical protein